MYGHIRLFTLLVSCAFLGTMSPDGYAQQQRQRTYEEMRDQGLLYRRKKRYKQAYRALKEAQKHPKAAEDFKLHFGLARTAAKLLLLEEAFLMADKSQKLAGDNEGRRKKVVSFRAELDAQFGGVSISAAKGETNREGRVFLEAKTGIINKKKREVFQTIRKRFRETEIKIPTIIYLPHGNYLANNVPVTVKPNELTEVQLYLQVVRKKVVDKGLSWWWIGSGIAATIATGIVTYIAVQDPIVEEFLTVVPVSLDSAAEGE